MLLRTDDALARAAQPAGSAVRPRARVQASNACGRARVRPGSFDLPRAIGRDQRLTVCRAAAGDAPPASPPGKDVRITSFSTWWQKTRAQVNHLERLTTEFPNTQLVDARLDMNTVALAAGCEVVSAFVSDNLSAPVIEALAQGGTKMVAMRCAGTDNVDFAACAQHGIRVTRVPHYSPTSVAEQAVGLAMALNRKLHRAYCRTREANFSLAGLVGQEMSTATVGVVGTGAIGSATCRIMKLGFGSRVLAFDMFPSDKMKAIGVEYVDTLGEMLGQSDFVFLHCPLTPQTKNIINKDAIAQMKDGVTLINNSRGGLLDTTAAIEALERGKIGALGLDVYMNEQEMFFTDWSGGGAALRLKAWDRNLALLLSLPNVIVTPHSGFLTQEALNAIDTEVTRSVMAFASGAAELPNECKPK
ncbi:unnamed protein product [Pedinophyceae sp. YPF-701]|nr:unnamed protein product [Pedinophyceae sp. YPF-701]